MLISAIETKVKRIVGDSALQLLDSDAFLSIFNNAQQRFARETRCLVQVVSLLAPPNIDYCITHNWEEGYVSGSVFNPFFHTATYAATQPFELSADHDLAGDGITVTSGVELLSDDPQHPVPFFFPEDCYAHLGIFWNYKMLEQISWDEIQHIDVDGWHKRGSQVDFFATLEGRNRRGFVTRSIPYDVGSATNEATAIDTALVANVFYVIYYQIPPRAEATSESVTVPVPWAKYLEYFCLWRYFSMRTQYADPIMAQHFKQRYDIGVRLVKRMQRKLIVEKIRQLGGYGGKRGKKPPYPRLPDHYPKMRLR